MKKFSIIAALALVCMATTVTAGNGKGVYPPDKPTPYGTYAELSAQWWQWACSIPVDSHPLNDLGPASLNQPEHLWFLGGTWTASMIAEGTMLATATRSIEVPRDTALFFPILNAECSTWELQNLFDPPMDPTDENLTDVATDWMDPAKVMQCKIDGRAIGDVWGYRVVSAPFDMALCEGNLINGEAGSTRAVSDGVYLLVAPLPVGQHTIEFYGYSDNKIQKQGMSFNFILDIEYTITVK